MPHITIKMYEGQSEEKKQSIARAIEQAMLASSGCSEASLSIAIQDFGPDKWMAEVYEPEIRAQAEFLYKKPGYGSL